MAIAVQVKGQKVRQNADLSRNGFVKEAGAVSGRGGHPSGRDSIGSDPRQEKFAAAIGRGQMLDPGSALAVDLLLSIGEEPGGVEVPQDRPKLSYHCSNEREREKRDTDE